VELTKTLSLAGEHTVVVNDGFNGALTGGYSLWVQRLNDPGNAVPLSGGDPITGTIATIGEIDTFVISGDAGDTLIVSASNKSGSPWPELRLYTPSGALLAADSASTHVEITPTLSSGGSHTLLVGDGFNGTLVGAYAVQLQALP